MSEYTWLTVYCLLVLLFSLFGVTHGRLQLYLSASAGVMLGAAFFHVMPDAMEITGAKFGWWISLAVVGLFCVERFVAPHSHELDHHCQEHLEGPGQMAAGPRHGNGAAAPPLAGWMAVAGLTFHTFMNGVGLAGMVQFDADAHAKTVLAGGGPAALMLPGLAIFLAIVLHKPADALAISMVLSRKRASPRRIALVQLGFALMVPVGAVVFGLTRGAIQGNLRGELTGAALALSAGTFLFIALADLLPEVQFHRHDRFPLFAALVGGVVLMGGIALLEGHEHEPNADAKIAHAEARGDGVGHEVGDEHDHHHHH